MVRSTRRSKEQLKKTSAVREDVFTFMRDRFHARHFWTIDGPMHTDVDEILCFAIFAPNGDTLGIVLVQTWLRGGWELYQPPYPQGTYDETERAIHTTRAAPGLLAALEGLLVLADEEIEQRKHGGNAEAWETLQAQSDACHRLVKAAKQTRNPDLDDDASAGGVAACYAEKMGDKP